MFFLYLSFLILGYSVTVANLPTDQNSIDAVNNNQHSLHQTITINQQRDPQNCSLLTGKSLVDCMDCQSPESFRKNLMNFNDRMAQTYFLSLSLHQYQRVLSNFNEKQWVDFLASRTQEGRKNFPRTLDHQRYILKKIYLRNYYTNVISFLWAWPNLDKTDDLEKVAADFDAADYNGLIFEYQKRQLNHEFEIYKKVLFNAYS